MNIPRIIGIVMATILVAVLIWASVNAWGWKEACAVWCVIAWVVATGCLIAYEKD